MTAEADGLLRSLPYSESELCVKLCFPRQGSRIGAIFAHTLVGGSRYASNDHSASRRTGPLGAITVQRRDSDRVDDPRRLLGNTLPPTASVSPNGADPSPQLSTGAAAMGHPSTHAPCSQPVT